MDAPERLVLLELHGKGWVTVRRDDGEQERIRTTDLAGPFDEVQRRYREQKAEHQRLAELRLTWEQFSAGEPCPGCGRPYQGNRIDVPGLAVQLLEAGQESRTIDSVLSVEAEPLRAQVMDQRVCDKFVGPKLILRRFRHRLARRVAGVAVIAAPKWRPIGVTDSWGSLRMFSDGSIETPLVKAADVRRVHGTASASGSAYGSGINVGKDSRRAAWSTPSPIASVLPVNVRSARRRQERAHQRRWRRRQSRRSHPPHVVAGLPRWPPSGHLEVPIASPPRATRQGPCRGVP
jgi:hypothetical protein